MRIKCRRHQIMRIVGVFCGENRTNLTADDYWLGLRKTASGYEWFDGNPSSYRNWAAGEPDDDSQCIIFTIDGFKDISCWSTFYYVCKKPAGNVHTKCSR